MAESVINCPVCGNVEFSHFLDVKDYFFSNETFSIKNCDSCGFRFISPRPEKSEISRYYQSDEYISHDVQKKTLINRIYKLARVISIHGKYSIVKQFCSGGKILDIGCGTGEFLHYCREKGFEVTGVEPNDKAREYAKKTNLITTYDQLETLSDSRGSINCITMWHVLEHIHHLNELILVVKELLAPKGVFIVAVPNSNSWDASYYGKFWAAYDVPRHLYHFTNKTMQMLASNANLEVNKIYPQKLDAYYVSMLSEKYRSGKMNFIKSFFQGFRSNCQAGRLNRGHSSLIFVMTPKKA